MPPNRWPKKIWQFDRVTGTEAWFSEVKYILNFVGLNDVQSLEHKVDIDDLGKRLMNRYQIMECTINSNENTSHIRPYT